jgi:hypothetical protein
LIKEETMPIEIREIIIKTEISTGERKGTGTIKDKDLNALKKQLLEECKRMISETSKKQTYKR